MLISKVGPISIGAGSDVGSRCMIISTGGIQIGENATLAGDCKIGGSVAHLEDAGTSARDSSKISKGKLIIGEDAILYMSVRVLDGVAIGSRAVIGSGISVQESVPEDSIVAVHQKLVYLSRASDSAGREREPEHAKQVNRDVKAEAADREGSSTLDASASVTEAVYAAIDEMNLLRSNADLIEKSLSVSLEALDSMDKVNLIVETEQKLTEKLGIPVHLDGQVLASNNVSVFETVETFVGEIVKLINER